MSFYVDLIVLDQQKASVGEDLKRAIEQTDTEPQALQLVSRRAFTVTHRMRDERGRVISQTDREAHSNE